MRFCAGGIEQTAEDYAETDAESTEAVDEIESGLASAGMSDTGADEAALESGEAIFPAIKLDKFIESTRISCSITFVHVCGGWPQDANRKRKAL